VRLFSGFSLHYSDFKRNNRKRRVLIFEYRALDNVQLAGVIWRCTGYLIKDGKARGMARFENGDTVELRGKNGRLFDLYGKLAPNKNKKLQIYAE